MEKLVPLFYAALAAWAVVIVTFIAGVTLLINHLLHT